MHNWRKGICEANGIKVHYLRTGGEKPPVVLLHGLTANGACWAPLAKELEEDCDVVMPDARGHGSSSAPDLGYCYDSLASDVLDLIDALGLENPVLIGHSMGGMTAAVAAGRNCALLRGLILVDPTFLTPESQREVYESDVAAQHRRILDRPKEDYLTEMRIRHGSRSGELNQLLAEARFQTSTFAFDVLRPPNPDFRQLISALDIPGLLVIGGVGAVVSSQAAAELARLNQRLEVVQIAEAGHGVPYDQPGRLAAVIKQFLALLGP